MQPLIQHLKQSGKLTAGQIEQIQSRLIFKTLQKGECFSEPERPADEMAFVLKGILRIFSHDPEGQESTHYFIDENNFAVGGGTTAGEGTAGKEYIQAVMRTELALFSLKALQNPSFTPSDWELLKAYINGRALSEKTEQISPTLAGDATARYKKFMEKYPQIAGRVPLSYLASYLGITQQSLSRIRKQLTKKGPQREE